MAHMKTQMDLLLKFLLVSGVEKVKVVHLYSRMVESNSKEEAKYLNNQGVSKTMAQEIKVRTIRKIIIIRKLVIEIVSKVIEEQRLQRHIVYTTRDS